MIESCPEFFPVGMSFSVGKAVILIDWGVGGGVQLLVHVVGGGVTGGGVVVVVVDVEPQLVMELFPFEQPCC